MTGSFFLLYGIQPSLVFKIFKLNPDEDVTEETKKDLKKFLIFGEPRKTYEDFHSYF